MEQKSGAGYTGEVMKQRLLILSLLSVSAILFGRGADDTSPFGEEPVSVHLIIPNGAPVATIAALEEGELPSGYSLKTEIIRSSDLVAAKLISGEADFGVIPSNLAATLYNKGVDIRICGPVIWGLLYVVSSEDLDNMGDLTGQTVSMIGRGLTPDITFRHLLSESGLEPDSDVMIHYVPTATELAPSFISGRVKVSMMPEPMLTTVLSKKPDTKIVVDVQEQWRKAYGAEKGYPQASLVVSGDFARNHPEYLSMFIDAYAKSVDSVNADPVSASEAVSLMSPELNSSIIAKAIPRMNLSYVAASAVRNEIEAYFGVLESFDPQSIGGALPGEDFYLR